MPVFDMMETLLVKKLNFRPTTILRFCVRSFYVGKKINRNLLFIIYIVGNILVFLKTLRNGVTLIRKPIYVAATMFLGMTFPFFGGLLAFFGGFAFAPTTYFVRLRSLNFFSILN